MPADEFAAMQAALLYVFLPIVQWLLALWVALGFIAGVFILWQSLLQWLSK